MPFEVKKIWINNSQPPKVGFIDHMLNINKVDKDKRRSFIDAEIDSLTEINGIKEVINFKERLKEEIDLKREIVFYTDYDADGIGGAITAVKMIEKLGGVANFYSNNRFEDGYGLCRNGIDEISEKFPNTKLIVTIDNGITAFEGIDYAKSLGYDVIITDHHEPKEKVPKADIIVNPKYTEGFKFKELSGAGLIWRLISQLYENQEKDTVEFLDYVAVSTVADVVPLLSDNRIIVKNGLKVIEQGKSNFFRQLNSITEEEDFESVSTLGFKYGPILNSIGRIKGDITEYVNIIIQGDLENKDIKSTVEKLVELNEKRKDKTFELYEYAEKLVYKKYKVSPNCIILQSEKLHPGLVGLIAGRIAGKFNRPTIIFSKKDEDNYIKGSARSISTINIFKMLNKIKNLDFQFGGHEMAAGMTLNYSELSLFEEFVQSYIENIKYDRLFVKKYMYHYELKAEDIDINILKAIELLEPYGEGFEKPLFRLINFDNFNMRFIGKNNEHLVLKDNTSDKEVIIWNGVESFKEKTKGKRVKRFTALGYPNLNTWNNNEYWQFIVRGDNFKVIV